MCASCSADITLKHGIYTVEKDGIRKQACGLCVDTFTAIGWVIIWARFEE